MEKKKKAALFTVAEKWKQPKCLLTDVAYTYNGISLSLKMEILTQATTWRKLENIMPSEISSSQKDTYTRYQEQSSSQTESRMVVTRG